MLSFERPFRGPINKSQILKYSQIIALFAGVVNFEKPVGKGLIAYFFVGQCVPQIGSGKGKRRKGKGWR